MAAISEHLYDSMKRCYVICNQTNTIQMELFLCLMFNLTAKSIKPILDEKIYIRTSLEKPTCHKFNDDTFGKSCDYGKSMLGILHRTMDIRIIYSYSDDLF